MKKLITLIIIVSFSTSIALKAQNESGLSISAKPGNEALNPDSYRGQKPKAPTPPAVRKLHAPSRPGAGAEIIDSAYNWISEDFLPVWGAPETKYWDYVYAANYQITSYVKDTLNGTAWTNENRYFFTYNSSDSVETYVVQTWSGSAWVNYDSTTYTYNTNGQITQQLDEEWSSGAWVNNDEYNNTYASTGQPALQEYQVWASGAWEYDWEYVYTYNSNNQLLTEEYELGSGTTWTPDLLYTYAYNSSGSLTLDEYQTYSSSTWDNQSETTISYTSANLQDSLTNLTGSGSTWVNEELYTTIYNTYNQETSYLYQSWSGSAWVNQWEELYTYSSTSAPNSEPATVIYEYGIPFTYLYDEIYTYNISGNDSTEFYLTWSGTAFDTGSRYFWDYNSSNLLTTELVQDYSSGIWVNADSEVYTYNSFGQETLDWALTWNSSSSAWMNSTENIWTYNSNDYEIFYEYQTGLGGGGWQCQQYNTREYDANNFLIAYSNAADESTNDSTHYYLNTTSGIKTISGTSAGSNMLIYPNPSAGTFTIANRGEKLENCEIDIYNVLGEKIYQSKINDFTSTYTLSLNQPNGVYFIRLYSGQGVMEGKIVIER